MNLGFLASHRGSNMQAIIDACKKGMVAAVPAVVISNNRDSGALERASSEHIPTYHVSVKTEGTEEKADIKICQILEEHDIDLVILAGYMRKIGPHVLKSFSGRIINIHPALLPKHGGQGMYGDKVHAAVLKAGEKETGVTVHVVNEEYDKGEILAQVRVKVQEGDTVETLSKRVLEAEHKIYVETIAKLANNLKS